MHLIHRINTLIPFLHQYFAIINNTIILKIVIIINTN